MKTKNKFLLALCVAAAFLFVSCVDVVQVVTFENGQYKYSVRMTVSKALVIMGGGNVSELEETFRTDDLPPDVQMNVINTDYDYGAEFQFFIDPATTDETYKSVLPKRLKSGKIEIPLFGSSEYADSMNSASDPDAEAVAKAILSSAKWRVYVSKKIVPQIKSAAIKTKEGETQVPFYEIGDMYCVEIPLPEVGQNASIFIES